MIEDRIKDLKRKQEQQWTKTISFTRLLQELAENFYPERADFTATRFLGAEFGANLTTSYPQMARRSLGDIFSTMLRPVATDWFSIRTKRQEQEDDAAKRWLLNAKNAMRNAMYARAAQFDRATKAADQDFACFGQSVISCELNRNRDDLLFRTWHLKDCRWTENYDGSVGTVIRKGKSAACELDKMFNGNISNDVRKLLDKTPYQDVDYVRVVIPAEDYDFPGKAKKPKNKTWVSIYYEDVTGHILEEIEVLTPIYVVPRWSLPGHSQYAYSPAAICALPDARLIQAMTLTLLEAGEKSVNPPLKTPGDVIRTDYQLFAGGITAYESEYDEKTGKILEPLYQIDKGGFGFAGELRTDTRAMITQAFFLDKVSMPPMKSGNPLTATETTERIQEYIRNAMPIFAPIEAEYNGALCELIFDTMQNAFAFGSPAKMPPSLSKAQIEFEFVSPLHDAINQKKGATFQQMNQLVAETVQADPSSRFVPDAIFALRDTLEGIGVPANWIRDPQQAAQMAQDEQKQQQAQQTLQMMTEGGKAAGAIAQGGQGIQQLMQPHLQQTAQ